MRNVRFLLYAILVCVTIHSAAGAQAGNIARAKQFVAARDRADYAAVRSLLAPNARLWFYERKGEGMPLTYPWAWSNWDVYFEGHSTHANWKQAEDQVTVSGIEINDFYRLVERKPVPFKATWWFDDRNRITGFLFQPIENGSPKDRLEEFKAWAKQHRPAELEYIMPKGEIDPTEDRPQRWRAILVEWRKAAGLKPVKLRKQ